MEDARSGSATPPRPGTRVSAGVVAASADVDSSTAGQRVVLVHLRRSSAPRSRTSSSSQSRAGIQRHASLSGRSRSLGEDAPQPPSAFIPRSRPGIRAARPRAGAVRRLLEPVPQRLRPDPDRLEQDVVLRVTRHSGLPVRAAARRRPASGSVLAGRGRKRPRCSVSMTAPSRAAIRPPAMTVVTAPRSCQPSYSE